MKSFEYAAHKTVEEAASLLGESWGQTEILAGGTDLVTSLKQEITSPKRVVSLKNVAALKGIKTSGKDLRIGAMTTLAELAENAVAQKEFPALVTAAQGVASPQMMSTGTVGGDLCQRPRCWYFRNGHAIHGKDGGGSPARDGENRYHAIFATDGPALFVSASSLGPALVALGATVVATGPKGKKRDIPAAQFFQAPKSEGERETTLKPKEILTEIRVPMRGMRNAAYEVRHRYGLDWPYVTAVVAFTLKSGVASDTRVVLGHVAPTPWAAADAGKSLDGQVVDAALAAKAGASATTGAKPLSGNAYKVQLVKTAVKRATLAAAGV